MSESVSEDAGAPDLRRTRRQKSSGQHRTPTIVDRLPPHSIECEMGVLGCVLLSPNDCMGDSINKLRAGPECFYDLRHQVIYANLLEMFEARKPIDLITLQQFLKDKQLLEQVGGIAYLSTLPDSVPSAANLDYYLEFVTDKYLLRRMIHVCTEAVGSVYEYRGDVNSLLDQVERDVLSVHQERAGSDELPTAKQMVDKALQTIESAMKLEGGLIGLSTGFSDLDKMTGGLCGGEMFVVAARPSLGKTSIAMNIVEHAVLIQRVPVGVFSLEMTHSALMLRMICSHARVNYKHIRDGFLAESDYPKITNAAGKLANAPLYIDDRSGISVMQLRARARRLWQKHDIKLFVVDYMQLLIAMRGRHRIENRQQEVSEISSGIKALAKELNVPIIVLSQLNRGIEKEKSRKPRLSDLRESGAIEQDADVVGMLYKPNAEEDEADADAVATNLYIAKQRNGSTGDVDFTFMRGHTRFELAAKIDEGDTLL